MLSNFALIKKLLLCVFYNVSFFFILIFFCYDYSQSNFPIRYVENSQMAILRQKMAILSNDYLVTLLVPKRESRPNFESKIKT